MLRADPARFDGDRRSESCDGLLPMGMMGEADDRELLRRSNVGVLIPEVTAALTLLAPVAVALSALLMLLWLLDLASDRLDPDRASVLLPLRRPSLLESGRESRILGEVVDWQ